MDECDLPEFHIEYLANIIYEDPPRNIQDMIFIVKDFMENKPEMTQEEVKSNSQKILDSVKTILKD